MIKKGITGAAVVVLLLGFLYGRDAISLVATTYGEVRDAASDMISVETRVKQARGAIKDLEGPIEEAMETIAREEVAVAKLERQLAKTEGQLSKDRNYLETLRDALTQQSGSIVLAGKTYESKEVKESLTREFKHFKGSESKLDQLQKVRQARATRLRAARDKLDAMKVARRQLVVDVENLEARMKMIEVAETTSELSLDDSELSRTRDLVEEISTRLDVAEELLETRSHYVNRIPLEDENEDDIVDQVTTYFGSAPVDSRIAQND